MRWVSGNIGAIGFDRDPEVYLMGHSSGGHISLLYLIRQAHEKEAEIAARHHARGLPVMVSASATRGARGGDGEAGGGRQLEVEGFIGLAGVYDVHRHYLYESWRSVVGVAATSWLCYVSICFVFKRPRSSRHARCRSCLVNRRGGATPYMFGALG